MTSTNFTYQDALTAVREQISDASARRFDDTTMLTYYLPRVLQQLRADRPDLWMGLYGTEQFKPSAGDAIPFDDAGFNALVEALLATVTEREDEALQTGEGAAADSRSQRDAKT